MPALRVAISVFAFFFLALPAAAQTIDYKRLDERLTALMSDPQMVGLAVAVIENGDIAFAEGYGVTQRDGAPVTADTVFRWASLSKGVASTMAGLVAEDGLFSLTDAIGDYSSSLRLPRSGHQTASLADVLSHRLGIVNNAYDTRLEDGRDPVDIRRALSSLKPLCPVSDCHTYQNVAFDAIAEAIENVVGDSYADAVQKRLFEPLYMTNASLGRAALLASDNWARPYAHRRGRIAPTQREVRPDYYRVPAAGGVNGSILDLARFARAQMGLAPDVLPAGVLQEIHLPRIHTTREQGSINRRYAGRMKQAKYALGWRVYDYAGNRVVGHRGAVQGYRSLILFDPEKDTGVVALWNSSARRPVGVQFEVMDMAFGLPAQDWLGVDASAANH
ncbi:MAG: serine hydrolase domain-containing protein [Pseudomonadota bacterium]